MPDYPRNQAEFEAQFATEDACRAYLERLRWPDGFRCPQCRDTKAWPVGRLWQCAACGRQTSLTAGTIFQDTRTPLTVWMRAMWAVTGPKSGTSALALQRLLGLGSYQTAWTWLHKLRRAMVRPGRDRLTGRVEVDETFVGALEEGATGRGAVKKVLIVVAVEYKGREIGRIRLRRVRTARPTACRPSSTRSSSPAVWCTPMGGWATTGSSRQEKLGRGELTMSP